MGRAGEVRRSVYHTIYESCRIFKICTYGKIIEKGELDQCIGFMMFLNGKTECQLHTLVLDAYFSACCFLI